MTKTKQTTRKGAGPKFTYQERVLNALYSEHKNHKKNNVHMATLNAQIKKNATLNNDKLGPHWKKFVTKAVHTLESQGAVSALDVHGAVSLTPKSKKAVLSARKDLSMGETGDDMTPAQQELLWKRVSATVADRAPRRSSIRPSQPRQSVNPGEGGSLSKLTKAQLREQLEDLQMEHKRAMLRDTSPLTDIDAEENDEENRRLKSQLIQMNDQMQAIQRELESAKHQAASQYFRSERFATPEPTQQPTPRTYLAPPPPPPMGIQRTDSGAWIPNISKHPTPAPTSPGADTVMDYNDSSSMIVPFINTEEDEADFFSSPNRGSRSALARQSSMLDQLKEHQFENEQVKTQLAMRDQELALKTVQLAGLQLDLANATSSHQARVSQLEAADALQQSTLAQLNAEVAALQN